MLTRFGLLLAAVLALLATDALSASRRDRDRERPRPNAPIAMRPIPDNVRVPERPVARRTPPRRAAARTAPRRRAVRAAAAASAATAAAVGMPTAGPMVGAAPVLSGPLPRTQAMNPVLLEAFVDGVVGSAMKSDRIAGVTVAVVQDGRILLSKGYGVASLSPRRPVDPERTLFRIASISKTFTWLLMAQQIEAGRYGLDTPINDLLPETLHIPEQGFEQPIRVRHLMTHSAGFEDTALGHLFEVEDDQLRPLEQYLAEERPDRVRPPGVVSTYSNYGVGLAGAIVARTAGRPYETLLEERLLRPLRLDHTTAREPHPAQDDLPAPMSAALARDVSVGFDAVGGGFAPQPYEHVIHGAPAGGLSSTAGDMSRYMLALLAGGRLEAAQVFGPRTTRGLTATLFRSAPGVNGWTTGFNEYALPGGLRGVGHGGTLSHFKSDMVLVPDLRLGIFISTNTATGSRLANGLAEQVIRRFYGAALDAPRPGDATLLDRAGLYEGTWMSTRRPYSGLEKLAYTFNSTSRVDVTPDGRLRLAGGGRPSLWVPSGRPHHFIRADGDDVIAFSVEGDRAVRSYAPWGGEAFDRAPFHRTPNGLLLFGALALAAAALTLVGPVLRFGQEIRPTTAQTVSGVLLLATAAGWLAAAGLFGAWAARALSSTAWAIYNWPGGVALASTLALISALATLILLIGLVGVWRSGDRRAPGWSVFRKMRHTTAVLVFAAFAVVLMLNGALEPWTG